MDLDFDTDGPDGAFTHGHGLPGRRRRVRAILDRIRANGIDDWADPGRREIGSISHHDGGQGVYVPSPDDHLVEVITVPYGGPGAG